MFMYIYVCITVDLNSGPKLTGRAHNRAVLCLQVDGDRVISGSENSISVWDWRFNKQLQLIQVRFYIHTLISLHLNTYVCVFVYAYSINMSTLHTYACMHSIKLNLPISGGPIFKTYINT